MLIRYSCKDMGLNCSFMVKGGALEEVTRQALVHVQEIHAAEFNQMNTAAEIERMERALSRSTREVTA